MSPLKYIFVLFLAVSLQFSCDSDNAPSDPIDGTPEEMEDIVSYDSIMNVSYGSDSKQVYDIYLPKNSTTATKVMILVHGGGWDSGDKTDDNVIGFKEFFTREFPEVALVNVNYRLADENTPPFPMQTDDITSIVNDLKSKQANYKIGTDLGLFGISDGGHIALLWSYAFDVENKVDMVGTFVGPTNLTDANYLNSEDPVIIDILSIFDRDIEALQNISPLFIATVASPPTISFYGGQDPLIPITQGFDLFTKLEELGVENDYNFYEGEGHGWIGTSLEHSAAKLELFVEEHFVD